jgi:hypothetical protein
MPADRRIEADTVLSQYPDRSKRGHYFTGAGDRDFVDGRKILRRRIRGGARMTIVPIGQGATDRTRITDHLAVQPRRDVGMT